MAQASALLGLSGRQVKRLKSRYSANDAAWVYHGNRGREPANRLAKGVREQVLKLAQERYAGFNDIHMSEKLRTVDKLAVSRASLQRILRGAGLSSPQKRRPPQYRSRRPRREQEGMMLQTDASRHPWLEGRGPELTLLGFIDDATGQVVAAHLQEAHEDTAGYLRLTRRVVEHQGIPLSIYRGQHGAFQRNDPHWTLGEQLAGSQAPTQLGRCWQELGIQSLAAATHSQPVYRKRDARLDLDYIFALRYQRVVNPDHTIVVGPGLRLQLPPVAGRGYAGQPVEVCQQPNGDVKVYLDRRLLYEEAAESGTVPVRAHRFLLGRPRESSRRGQGRACRCSEPLTRCELS